MVFNVVVIFTEKGSSKCQMDFDIHNFLSFVKWKIFTVFHIVIVKSVKFTYHKIFHSHSSIFTGIHTNTTSISIGVEGGGGGEPWSGGQRVRQHWKQPNSIHWCHFQLHVSYKAAKSMVNLISQSFGDYSWLSACPGYMEPFKDHTNTHGCLTSLRNKPQQKQSGQLSASMLVWIVS